MYILLICENYISLRGEVWAHKTNLTPPLFIEVPVLSQHIEQSCVSEVYSLLLFPIFLLDFEAVVHFDANSVTRYNIYQH
jgi:hypothetical protein